MTADGGRMALAPEFEVLRLTARRHFDDAARQALRDVVCRGVDWRKVLTGVARHRVTALVKPRLRADNGLPVPGEVENALSRMAMTNARKALSQAAEIVRLTGLLAAAGVRAMVLKGVPLAYGLYGDIAARGVGDIDLLTAPEDFYRANEILNAAGYVSEHGPLSAPRLKAELRSGKDWTLHRPDTGSVVELHHRLIGSRTLLPDSFDDLWRDRAEIPLGQGSVATLSTPLLPVYLCVHGDRHAWSRLQWLIDLERFFGGPDDDGILEMADRTGNGRSMRRAIALGRDWLGPDAFGSHSIAESVRNDARRFARRMFSGDDWLNQPSTINSLPRLQQEFWRRYHIWEMRPHWRDVWEEIRQEGHNSTDWSVMRLPSGLTWLYPWLRPVGWALRRLKREGQAGPSLK